MTSEKHADRQGIGGEGGLGIAHNPWVHEYSPRTHSPLAKATLGEASDLEETEEESKEDEANKINGEQGFRKPFAGQYDQRLRDILDEEEESVQKRSVLPTVPNFTMSSRRPLSGDSTLSADVYLPSFSYESSSVATTPFKESLQSEEMLRARSSSQQSESSQSTMPNGNGKRGNRLAHSRALLGLPSLHALEQKYLSIKIPELELPGTSETSLSVAITGLQQIRDDLEIYLQNGIYDFGSKANDTTTTSGAARKRRVSDLLDEVSQEIGLYEQFSSQANSMSLEAILNESDHESDDFVDNEFPDTDSAIYALDSASDISRQSSLPLSAPSVNSNAPQSPVAQPTSFPSIGQRLSSMPMVPTIKPPLHHRSHNATSNTLPQSTRPLSSSSLPSLLSTDSETTLRPESSGMITPSIGSGDGRKGELEPYETLRWTPLIAISDNVYANGRDHGLVTGMAVGGIIAIGTSRGQVYVYDYSQNLKCIIGAETKGTDYGSVTALAISADHTCIAVGHSSGFITLWDITHSQRLLRTIEPLQSVASLTDNAQTRKEGHVHGSTIVHVGFVGVRNDEVVSADNRGMAFWHTLYRVIMVNGMETTRILGRYPIADNLQPLLKPSIPQDNLNRRPKASAVFAMQTMPLGQAKHFAESFSLIALLTPHKMVIVGLKPSPQTHYKQMRPKTSTSQPESQLNADSALSGALAWLPSYRLANRDGGKITSDPLIAFAWGTQLFVRKVATNNSTDKHTTTKQNFLSKVTMGGSQKTTTLNFVAYGEWKSRDPIVALQWLNRQLLLVLTSTEHIVMLHGETLMVIDVISVKDKQLVFHDYFSESLAANEYCVTPGVVQLAFSQSLRSYKGKLFLLGVNQFFVGNMLSWADRILGLVESGDFLEAISLATAFYCGNYTNNIIGLPENENARQEVVGSKLMELIEASLNYAFSSQQASYKDSVNSGTASNNVMFKDLANITMEACIVMDNIPFLLDFVYDRFIAAGVQETFLEALEPYIVSDRITALPPDLSKDLVSCYASRGYFKRLESIICHVTPESFDLDQVLPICSRERLFDATMYVWSRCLNDFVSPIIDVLDHMKNAVRAFSPTSKFDKTIVSPMYCTGGAEEDGSRYFERSTDSSTEDFEKLFQYLEHTLTGKAHPDGKPLPARLAHEARSSVYAFIFSGRCIVWPPGTDHLILTADNNTAEPTYPYLRIILNYNAKRLFTTLTVAFEDPWLNGVDNLTSDVDDDLLNKSVSRQLIVNTLLDVLATATASDALDSARSSPDSEGSSSARSSSAESVQTALYIFISDILPKYSTFILISPLILQRILQKLCTTNNPGTSQAREQAVQQLLAVHNPPDEELMIQLYLQAGFYKVLQGVYRADKQYGKLIECYLQDKEQPFLVFDCMDGLLSLSTSLTNRQRGHIEATFMRRLRDFVEIDGAKTAELVSRYFGGNDDDVVNRLLEHDEEAEDYNAEEHVFWYLQGVVVNHQNDELLTADSVQTVPLPTQLLDMYLEQLCHFQPSSVLGFLQSIPENTYDSGKLPNVCRRYNVIEAEIWILQTTGNAGEALSKILALVKDEINDIIRKDSQIGADKSSEFYAWTIEERASIETNLIDIRGLLKVAIQICESNSREYATESNVRAYSLSGSSNGTANEKQNEPESLWFQLLDTFVDTSKTILAQLTLSKDAESSVQKGSSMPPALKTHTIVTCKAFVHSILTSLLLSTANPQVSLPRLLVRLVQSQPNEKSDFADFKDIFLGILETFKYEGELLELTGRLLEKDVFRAVQSLVVKRERGWRPRKTTCELCGAPFWLDMITSTNEYQASSTTHTDANAGDTSPSLVDDAKLSNDMPESSSTEQPSSPQNGQASDSNCPSDIPKIIVHRCGHAYHAACLDIQVQKDNLPNGGVGYSHCLICEPPGHVAPGEDEVTKIPHSSPSASLIDKGKAKA